MERRTFVRTVGAGLVAGTLAGCSILTDPETPSRTESTPTTESTATPEEATTTPEEQQDRFERVVDVTEAGADPTGSERVDDVVQELADDDTLLEFPPGRYLVGRIRLPGYRNLGLAGRDATLVADRPGRTFMLTIQRASDLLVEGFTVDASAKNTAAWCDIRCVGGTNVVRDYSVRGFVDVEERTNGFTLMVEGADTSLELDRVRLPDGAAEGAATFVFPRSSFVDPSSEPGTITFRDCVMKGWGVEGLYASAHSGPVNVIGGEYANNAIVQVRVGGGNAPANAVVRDVNVVVDRVPEYFRDEKREFRGIWLKEGDLGTVENCDVSITNVPGEIVQAGIVVNQQFGRSTIRNTRVRMDVPSPAVLVEEPTTTFDAVQMPALEHLPAEWFTQLRKLSITTTSSHVPAIQVEGRDGCLLTDVDVEASGSGADGIEFVKSRGCTIRGGSVVADRYPVLAEGPPDAEECWVSIEGSPRLETTSVTDRGHRLVDTRATASTAPGLSEKICIRPTDVPGYPQDYDVLVLTEASSSGLYGRMYDLNDVPTDV